MLTNLVKIEWNKRGAARCRIISSTWFGTMLIRRIRIKWIVSYALIAELEARLMEREDMIKFCKSLDVINIKLRGIYVSLQLGRRFLQLVNFLKSADSYLLTGSGSSLQLENSGPQLYELENRVIFAIF